MPTHCGEVCELWRSSRRKGRCLRGQKIAQHAARGWRSPPPPRREQRREVPGAAAPGVEEEGEPEVEGAAEPEVEGMEE